MYTSIPLVGLETSINYNKSKHIKSQPTIKIMSGF